MTPQPIISENRHIAESGTPPTVLCDIAPPAPGAGGAASKMWIEMLEEFRAERDELRRRLQMIPRVRQDAAVQISELEAAHQAIRMARDSLLTQVHSLARNRDDAAGQIAELTECLDDARAKLSAKQLELDALNRTCEKLRAQLQKYGEAPIADDAAPNPAANADSEKVDAESRCLSKAELAAGLASAERRIAALDTHIERVREQQREGNFQINQQLIASEKERGAAVAAVASLQNELATVFTERDAMRKTIADMEAGSAALRAEAAEFSRHADSAELIRRQRSEIADLTAQLDATREELRLAWALRPATDRPEDAPSRTAFIRPASVALDAVATRQAVAGMASLLTAAVESPEPGGRLVELGEQLPILGQRALCAGWLSIRRLAAACAEIAGWLVKKPIKIGTMPLSSGRHFLSWKKSPSPPTRASTRTRRALKSMRSTTTWTTASASPWPSKKSVSAPAMQRGQTAPSANSTAATAGSSCST